LKLLSSYHLHGVGMTIVIPKFGMGACEPRLAGRAAAAAAPWRVFAVTVEASAN
jgi:hypothetical protein